ncbi:hypothetical protein PR001_g14557 [Phytophthora rubi]|nr:hypothetical protein PR001_g14557 [Phytophthora rubi]
MARIRSSKQTKQAAEVRAVDFKHLWRQLRAVGWKSKRPTGLATVWTYYTPSAGNEPHAEGVNVFTGEDSVEFAIASGIISLGDSSDEDDDPVDKDVTASQIDCSVALSAPTLDALFESTGDAGEAEEPRGGDVNVLQHTGPRVLDLSQRALNYTEGSDQEVVVGAFQQMLSEVNGGAPVSQVDGADTCEAGDEAVAVEEVATATPARADDVNILKDSENSDDFEDIDSSGSDGEDSQDEEEVERREYPEDDEPSDEEVELVDEAFIESLGGSLSIDNIDKQALRATMWGTQSSSFETNQTSYARLSEDIAAPIRELQNGADSPLMLFFYFLPKTLWAHIAEETNRFEVYVGARSSEDSKRQPVDNKTGAAAVIRNMKIVLEHSRGFRLVVIDRFYSSEALALELLSMSIYVIGTIMTNRIGFDKQVVQKRKTRSRTIERGSFGFSRCVAVPTMVACHWWDRKPVHYLATGVAMTEDTIQRNLKLIGPATFTCPKLVTDYQRWIGGVDIHDQLRLQSYSIQTAFRFRKYYKSLFLGFVDIAVVNAFITHKEACRLKRVAPMSRGEWMGVLHNQLLQLKPDDFAIEPTVTPLTSARSRAKRRRQSTHTHSQFDDWVTVSGVQKRRQRSCKVCALLRGERKKSFQTIFFCEDCSNGDVKCFICPKARREYKGMAKTCFQIWHGDFACGDSIPDSLGKRVVLRRPGKIGMRKKTRRELLCEEDAAGADDEEDQLIATVTTVISLGSKLVWLQN